jgi:hypothetical protein
MVEKTATGLLPALRRSVELLENPAVNMLVLGNAAHEITDVAGQQQRAQTLWRQRLARANSI